MKNPYHIIKEVMRMENMIYLLNMTVSGIKSIKKEVRLDFYKKTIDKNFNPDKYRIKAIYGENGSGKSAIITAVKIFRELLLNNNYLNESNNQIFLEEIVNKSTHQFSFSCEFLLNLEKTKMVYRYYLRIGKSDTGIYEIQSEMLEVKNGNYANKNYSLVFRSQNGELLEVNASDDQKEVLKKKSINLLTSHSFIWIYITNAKHLQIPDRESIDRDLAVHMMLCTTFVLSIRVYLAEEDQHELYFLRKRLAESPLDNQELQKAWLSYAKAANAFSSVNEKTVEKEYYDEYKKKVEQLAEFIKIFKPQLVSIDIDAKENGNQYECELNLNYGDYVINKEFESTGIKKLIGLFDCFVAANTMGIVFVDEMDSNLNDVYLCKLIEYFMYYGKGQLCFTTHNIDPMSVLKENKNSIDFLSSDNQLNPWTSRGNASPENSYKNGMIADLPFNIDATDFVGIFGE